jgi:hypothetical protein
VVVTPATIVATRDGVMSREFKNLSVACDGAGPAGCRYS